MNNFSFLLGLVLIYIPACLSQNNNKQCFSLSLDPPYPCCTGDKVILTDDDGDWGVENNQWCGIDKKEDPGFFDKKEDSCFSIDYGYPCCESCHVILSDEAGDWGVEDNQWCGIKDSCTSNIEKSTNSDFDLSFLKLENNKENMIYSPLSIGYALKMLQEGANSNTLTEINNVIGDFDPSKYSNIDQVLSLANGIFIKNTYYNYVKENYINTLQEKYNAEVKKDPFINAQNANNWIEEKTLGIIKDMLNDDMFQDPELVMLIINALAVNVEWATKFSIHNTYGGIFYLDNGEKMRATMMSMNEVKSNNIAYYKDNDITVLNMDLKEYNQTQFEFMAIMPKENLSAFVENVSKEQISEIDKNLVLSENELDGVNIRMPKFHFSYDLDLKSDLTNLGIKDAFDRNFADFSKLSSEQMFVSSALHKAIIEIDEKGVKAAAVTVFSGGWVSGNTIKHPVDIIINKPFMFIIREKNTKDIWFTGTVYQPNSWEDEEQTYEKERKSASNL